MIFKINPYLLLLFPCKLILLNTSLVELISKNNFDESILNSIFLFWTNYWWLTLFVLNLVLLFTFSAFKQKEFFFAQILFLFVWIEGADFWIMNYRSQLIDIYTNNLNWLLLDNFNKIHPGLLFWSGLGLLVYFNLLNQPQYFKMYIGIYWTFLNKYLLFDQRMLLIALTALYFGGWWAFLEGSWGGWWAWDASETLGLFIVFGYLFIAHVRIRVNSFFHYKILFKNIIYTTMLIYLLIQIYMKVTSHNFGIKLLFFLSNSFSLVELFFIIIGLLVYSNFRYKSIISRMRLTTYSLIKNQMNYFTSLLIKGITFWVLMKIVLVSFAELYRILIWNIFTIDILTLSSDNVTFLKENYLLYIFLLLLSIRPNFIFLAPLLNINFFIWSKHINTRNLLIFLHILILFFLFNNAYKYAFTDEFNFSTQALRSFFIEKNLYTYSTLDEILPNLNKQILNFYTNDLLNSWKYSYSFIKTYLTPVNETVSLFNNIISFSLKADTVTFLVTVNDGVLFSYVILCVLYIIYLEKKNNNIF